MTFKQNWEKTDSQHILPNEVIKNMIRTSINKEVESYHIISGGCANLNIRVQLKNQTPPLLLRIYLRDKDAASREQKISEMLQGKIPVPKIYFIGNYEEYKFAICEFIDGITLRDLLLGDQEFDMHHIMSQCGDMLAKISSIQFPLAGFFDKDLNIQKEFANNDLVNYAQNCLKQDIAKQQLKSDLILKIEKLLLEKKEFLPGNKEKNLVHADFDSSNILVQKIDNSWQIVAILDWEFAFSGSILCDIANMLRYAHQLPEEFEDSFMNSLQNKIQLPKDWKIIINLLNLCSLIDCLARSDSKQRPNQCKDIKLLITEIIDGFKL